ncbi:flagellar protein FlaG [Pseudohongiella sp. SYSU M77423]|uniref:flagellar protein FlaG n=1 Tax=Pseudohongiella sp. SYSU M77423 TaxID=3042312 RepID=UPI0024806759|nr:flagellar protein FlaG [Pseudohongiella sp. SYSU M77423]MDH7944887.1 flagellar protein FlaG [Pseudohongiella sp. SYSU M77423]
MSEISITRFQPALVARDKVKSVESVDNDLDANPSHNPLQDKYDEESSGQHKRQQENPSGQQHNTSRDSENRSQSRPARSTDPSAADEPLADDEALERAVTRLNEYVQTVKRDLIFDIDAESLEPSVTVVDRESRQVLRQFDSQEALELARKLDSEESISLFKTQV